MKRSILAVLASFLLFSFAAEARVILPKGGEEWSVGSSVLLQWDASDSPVEIHLIRPDQDPIVIAEGLANTDHYLWPIEELEAARDYRIEIRPSGGNAVQSRTFRIMAWDERQYLGVFEETDRSKVTHPLKAAVLDKDKDNRAVTVDWVDYRHFLKDNVRIFLYQVGNVRQLALKTKLDNTGRYDWELNDPSIEACSEGACYFVVRSGRKRGQFITSHPFTLGDNADARAYTVSSAAQQGSDLAISWQDNTDAPSEVRIDIVKEDAFYESVGESQSSPGDANTLSWPIPSTVRAGEYTLLLTKLADGTQRASSEPFVIETPEDAVKVAIKRKISTTTQTTLVIWANNRETVDIDLYRDGKWVKAIARDGSVASLRNWKLPRTFTEGDDYTVRVTQADNPEIFGFSDPFSISAPGATVAEAPSDKRCQKAGLDTGCTAEALKVALRQKQRDCVTYRLYGEECTVENIARARDENEERRALNLMVVTVPNCPEGEIAIGNQCRPESQCPGLALLDEPRPGDVVPYVGPRRCDQNLIQGLSMTDAYMAAMLDFLLEEMLSGDAELNSAVAVTLFRRYNSSIGGLFDGEKDEEFWCESAQAKAFYSDPICMNVEKLEKGGRRVKSCNRGDRPVCPAWGQALANGEPSAGRRHFDHEAFRHGFNRGGRNDYEPSIAGHKDTLFDGHREDGTDWIELSLTFESKNNRETGMMFDLSGGTGRHYKKGFYWPSEPVVHPDAFDALSPAARAHAEFIWRTAKIREALYDTSRLTNEDGELDRSRLNSIERQWHRPWVTGDALQPVVLVAEGGKDGTADLQLESKPHRNQHGYAWRHRAGWNNVWRDSAISQRYLSRREVLLAEQPEADYKACMPGLEVRDGLCEPCAPGTYKFSDLGFCMPCSRNLVAVEGAYGCKLCPMGQVPSENHSACIDSPCTGNEYWDSGTDRCVKGARARHKWSQMMYFDLSEDATLANQVLIDLLPLEAVLENASREVEVGITIKQKGASGLSESSYDDLGGVGPGINFATVNSPDDPIRWERYRPFYYPTGGEFRGMLKGMMERQAAKEVTAGDQAKGVMALHFSGHGYGFQVASRDMKEIRMSVREEIGDGRIDLITFDSCLMGNVESLLMLDGLTRWVIGSPEPIPESGFRWQDDDDDRSVKIVNTDLEKTTEKYVKAIVANTRPKRMNGRTTSPMVGYSMIHFPAFRDAFNAVLDYLADQDNMRNHETRLAKLIYENPEAKDLKPSCVQFDESGSPVALDKCATWIHGTTHLKFSTRRFLEAFIDPAVGQPLSGLATTALAELDRFMENSHVGVDSHVGVGMVEHGLFEGSIKEIEARENPLPFAWFIADPREVAKSKASLSIHDREAAVRRRMQAIPNWAPLDSLRRFNAKWAEIRGH